MTSFDDDSTRADALIGSFSSLSSVGNCSSHSQRGNKFGHSAHHSGSHENRSHNEHLSVSSFHSCVKSPMPRRYSDGVFDFSNHDDETGAETLTPMSHGNSVNNNSSHSSSHGRRRGSLFSSLQRAASLTNPLPLTGHSERSLSYCSLEDDDCDDIFPITIAGASTPSPTSVVMQISSSPMKALRRLQQASSAKRRQSLTGVGAIPDLSANPIEEERSQELTEELYLQDAESDSDKYSNPQREPIARQPPLRKPSNNLAVELTRIQQTPERKAPLRKPSNSLAADLANVTRSESNEANASRFQSSIPPATRRPPLRKPSGCISNMVATDTGENSIADQGDRCDNKEESNKIRVPRRRRLAASHSGIVGPSSPRRRPGAQVRHKSDPRRPRSVSSSRRRQHQPDEQQQEQQPPPQGNHQRPPQSHEIRTSRRRSSMSSVMQLSLEGEVCRMNIKS